MSSWRQRRKLIYLGSVVTILLLVVGIPAFFKFYKAPSCIDTKQNQSEEGVDCGGPCSTVCSFSAIDPIVRWARAFPLTSESYTAVAFVENPNTDATVSKISYTFKFYDNNNLFLAERSGTTFIPAKKSFPIFETNIKTGTREIKKTFFTFSEIPNWQKGAGATPTLIIQSKDLTNEIVAPKLSSMIVNPNLYAIKNISVVAVLYDVDDNAIASSQTFIEVLEKESKGEAIFTWPEPFAKPVARIEVYPRVQSR